LLTLEFPCWNATVTLISRALGHIPERLVAEIEALSTLLRI
jgi:hypothetical protein